MATDKPQLRFDGRVAIVTGAGHGLGRAYAHLLALRGAAVVVNDIRSDGAGDRVVAEIRDLGGTALSSQHSVASLDQVQEMVAGAVDRFGRLDVLVNNAGVSPDVELPGAISESAFDLTMKVTAYGSYYATATAWPHFVKQRYGRVIIVSSAAGLYGSPTHPHYAAAKAAVVGLARSYAIEGRKHGINVNLLCPSAFTGMTSALAKPLWMSAAHDTSPQAVAALMDETSTQVAPIVGWLAHEDCDLTGEIFEGNRGRVSRIFIAATQGYRKPDLTIEDVQHHMVQITDPTDFLVPSDSIDSWR